MSDTPRTDGAINRAKLSAVNDESICYMQVGELAPLCRELEKANADLRRELDEVKSKLEACEYDFKDIVDRE